MSPPTRRTPGGRSRGSLRSCEDDGNHEGTAPRYVVTLPRGDEPPNPEANARLLATWAELNAEQRQAVRDWGAALEVPADAPWRRSRFHAWLIAQALGALELVPPDDGGRAA